LKSGSTESDERTTGEADSFLSDCLRSIVHDEPLPPWPDALNGAEDSILARLAFHGIAPFLNSAAPFPSDWPMAVTHEVRKTAGLVSFWETTHRQAIASLLEGFARAGISVVITKGTALAYSVYPQPSLRRRGDTDIIVLSGNRKQVRAVLGDCGFSRDPAPRPLQEDWHHESAIGIVHAVDIHWRLNASAAISRLLEQGRCFDDRLPLQGLSPSAKGMGLAGNLILTSINRHSHGTMGYHIGDEKIFETDRLIWALDIYLLTRLFSDRDWQDVVEQAGMTGTALIVLAGLEFAERALGARIPPSVMTGLSAKAGGRDVATYFATVSGSRRMWMDLIASPTLRDKVRLVLRVMFASDAFLAERFPDAQGWPKPALHLRRWIEGVTKLASSRA
jgi:Uncharacterised nucleotidyltransferase